MFLNRIEPTGVVPAANGLLKPEEAEASCETCAFRGLSFCGALLGNGAARSSIRLKHRTAAARQNIYRAGEPSSGVLVVCEGWAVRFVQLTNGKRQILSVVVPGDLVSPTLLFERQFAFSIQAVTKVRYCTVPFADVRAGICENPALFDVWVRLTASEHRDADKRLVDLGQRSASERIAALLVHTMLRAEARGELQNGDFPFPLSQQQIADCCGLTPVHACRVLGTLRKKGICDVGRGAVGIKDRSELLRLGSGK
jgi:CRP/FNR family transcriptional regulator, anaerobic regulatory protein